MDNEPKIICPICKKEMTKLTDFGVAYIGDKLCAIVVASNCDCKKPMMVKYPIMIDKAFI